MCEREQVVIVWVARCHHWRSRGILSPLDDREQVAEEAVSRVLAY